MSNPEIVTFGCRLNAWEAEVMRMHAAGCGDLVVINSCAVTAEAERQTRQAIRRARRARPASRIVVTGCAAQIHPDRYAAMPEVDQVIGNDRKLAPGAFSAPPAARVAVDDIMAVRETAGHLISGFGSRSRAFLQIQTGCNHRCTFCIIPFGRGNSRSVPLGSLVEQVRTLTAAGVREIVLCGVNITSWGADLPAPTGFPAMIRRLLAAVPELQRLRLSSLDPADIDAELCELFAHEPRLMPHVHLSVQSGSDMVLKRMKRRHRRDAVIALCAALRTARPDMIIGADIIAGFPTESPAMHEETLALLRECEIAFPHVFPYSERPGTPAARMPPVPGPERKTRAAELRSAGAAMRRQLLTRRIGARAALLMETPSEGHTEHFVRARVTPQQSPGRIVPVRLVGHDGEVWHAEALAA